MIELLLSWGVPSRADEQKCSERANPESIATHDLTPFPANKRSNTGNGGEMPTLQSRF